jgi:hypothetical protein
MALGFGGGAKDHLKRRMLLRLRASGRGDSAGRRPKRNPSTSRWAKRLRPVLGTLREIGLEEREKRSATSTIER